MHLSVPYCVNAEHALHLTRRLSSNPADDPVRVGAAHDHGVGLTRQAHVVGEAALAPNKDRVLAAQNRLADAEFGDRPVIGIVVQVHWLIQKGAARARLPRNAYTTLTIGCVWMTGEGGTGYP
jgi:hypothetical protein